MQTRTSKRRVIFLLLALGFSLVVRVAGRAPREEVESVAAFARLYGVVRYFYPSDAGAALDWDRFAVLGVQRARTARDARGLEAVLKKLFEALGPGIEIGAKLSAAPPIGEPDSRLVAWRYLGAGIGGASGRGPYLSKRTNRAMAPGLPPFESAAPRAGAHHDVWLGSGLQARVPSVLDDAQARGEPANSKILDAVRSSLETIPNAGELANLDVRLADVVIAWNIFRHFYPYWKESGVDWDARLRPQIAAAYDATTRDAHRDALRQLVADARDGHGLVNDTLRPMARAWLPVQFGLVGNDVVITASTRPSEAPVGGAVSSIDGVSATKRLDQMMRLASGTSQWRQARALRELASCQRDAEVNVVFYDAKAQRTSRLKCDGSALASEKRPEAVVELTPGVWYVDLTRAQMEQVTPALPKLASATGVVFDVRGYPTDAGSRILPHLIHTPEIDRWMHVAKISGPFGQSDGWQSFGWNLKPATPRVAGTIVFLTDGRAISYAESVMGYVADRKLATIVGGRTAGTNGNVASFAVPGGFTIAFTGMRVTGHDGRTPFHLTGVKPDVAAAPSLAGLREGRDDVLARAVALIQGK